MSPLVAAVKTGLYLLMAVSVISALGAVILPNIFHAALALVVTLLGIAGIYIALQAEFLAVVQILLYVGAVMTLIIFAIMLTHRISDGSIRQKNNLSLSASVGGLLFFILISRILYQTPWPVNDMTLVAHVTTQKLGEALLGTYVFPFEVISIVLIAVLIGAVIIAKREKE